MTTSDIDAALSTLAIIVPLVAAGIGLAWWGEMVIGE